MCTTRGKEEGNVTRKNGNFNVGRSYKFFFARVGQIKYVSSREKKRSCSS